MARLAAAAHSGRPVLVAPDKFKGSLSASEVALAIGRGLLGAGIEDVELLPVADGGEGTMEILVRATGGRTQPAQVSDPLGREVTAAFGMLGDRRTAVVEVAQASGLWRLAQFERDPVGATSYGTGQLIGAAIDAGARTVIVAAGGSATTDGGRGALEALGAHFGETRSDLRKLRARIKQVKLVVACDVRNPLLGPDGSARVFATQKGASPKQTMELEQRLSDWAQRAKRSARRDPSYEPYSGAAGGLAGGLWAFAKAELRAGAPFLLDQVDFDSRMRDALAIVTGEGTLDEQTLYGKTVFEVSTRARQAGVPCYAVVGNDALDAFGRRLMDIEVESAGRGARAAEDDVERAAATLAKRL